MRLGCDVYCLKGWVSSRTSNCGLPLAVLGRLEKGLTPEVYDRVLQLIEGEVLPSVPHEFHVGQVIDRGGYLPGYVQHLHKCGVLLEPLPD